MNFHLTPSRLLAIALASFLAWPASAGSLYKVIDATGAIVFTDVPPPSDAGIVTEIAMGEMIGVAKPAGMPRYEIGDTDEAMARANARVDLAEHALAVARQGLCSHHGLSLAAERMTPGDWARVEFYKKGVLLARQQLMDLLRERQAPRLLASSSWQTAPTLPNTGY